MNTVPLRRLIQSVQNGAWGSEADEDEVNVLCVRAADFDFERLEVDLSRAPLRSIDQRTMSRLRLMPSDIVLEKSGGGEVAPVGRAVAFSHGRPAITSNFAARVRPTATVNPRFLVYVLRSLYASGATLKCIKQTTGIQNLDTEAWLQLPIVTHEMEVQRRIADFLDDRVARIDKIIAARRKQVDLLWAAFGSHITRVIDEADGRICPLWLMAERITDGAHVSPETEGGVYDFVSTRDLDASGSIDFNGSLKTSPDSYGALVRQGCRPVQGDVLFSKDGTVGRTARVTGNRDFVVASSLIIVRPIPARMDFNYLHYLFKHAEVANQVQSYVKGAGLPRISIANLRRVVGIFPPLGTQALIADRLDTEFDKTNALAGSLEASADLLAEYKQSLITAAVTGQLDVTTAGSGIPG